MSTETMFLLARLRDLSNEFHALSDACLFFELNPDIMSDDNNLLRYAAMKVKICELMLELNDVFDGTVYEWSKDLEKSEVK